MIEFLKILINTIGNIVLKIWEIPIFESLTIGTMIFFILIIGSTISIMFGKKGD